MEWSCRHIGVCLSQRIDHESVWDPDLWSHDGHFRFPVFQGVSLDAALRIHLFGYMHWTVECTGLLEQFSQSFMLHE